MTIQAANSPNKLIVTLSALFFLHRSPYIGSIMPSILYAFIVAGLFLVLIKNIKFREASLFFILIISILDVIFRNGVFGGNDSIFVVVSQIMQIAIYPLLTWQIYNNKDVKLAATLFLSFMSVELITYYTSAAATDINQLIVRLNPGELLEDNDEALYLLKKTLNVGNFDTVYGSALMIPVFIAALKSKVGYIGKWYVKVFAILALVLSYNLLFKAQFTIAFITGLVMTILFFLPARITPTLFRWSLVLGITLLVIFRYSLPSVLHYTAETIDSEIMSPRLEGIANVMEGKVDSGDNDTESRKNHYQQSYNAIKNYPFIGCWGATHVSGHSVIIDTYALYGILGLFLLFRYTKEYLNMMRPYKDYPMIHFYNYGFIAVLALFCVNPSMYQVELFFCYPVTFFIYSKSLETSRK